MTIWSATWPTRAERAQIENLRVIERVLASRPVAGPAAEIVPATRFYGRAGVRHAVHALIAIASLEVAATLLLLPWAWGDYSRTHGEVAAFMTIKFVGHAVAAGGVRGLSPAPARRQPTLAGLLRARVPVRAGGPVGVRARVPAGPSPDLAR